MSHTNRSLAVLFMSLGPTTTVSAAASPEGRFALSANGPGVDRTALSAGLGISGNAGGTVPTLDLRFAYGISSALDFDFTSEFMLQGRPSPPGVLILFDPGLLVRVTGKKDPAFSLGLKVGPEVLLLGTSRGSGAVFGVAPGLVLSTGGSEYQASFGLDFPMYLGSVMSTDRGIASEAGLAASFRPYVGLEGPCGSVGLYVRARPWFSTRDLLLMTGEVGVRF